MLTDVEYLRNASPQRLSALSSNVCLSANLQPFYVRQVDSGNIIIFKWHIFNAFVPAEFFFIRHTSVTLGIKISAIQSSTRETTTWKFMKITSFTQG